MKNIYLFIIVIFSLKSFSQDIERKNRYLFWTYHQRNVNTNGVSLGIGSFGESMNNYTNGLKIELIGLGVLLPLIPKSPIASSEIEYENLMKTPISERINGIVISGAGTVCDCTTNGINIGLIGHSNRKLNGISIALVMNIAQKNNGIQISAFNESFYMNGLQVGLTNYSYNTNGVQIGLLNTSKKLKGIQIGLWNVNQKRKFPLINWNFAN
jgi:hypothetical protein